MENYHTLYRIRVTHDYFEGKSCPALLCRLTPKGEMLARQRGLLFRQADVGEWTILYDSTGAGPDTKHDVLELELYMADPSFVLYTEWKGFRPSAVYELELPVVGQEGQDADVLICLSDKKRRIGTGFCTISLSLTEDMVTAAKKVEQEAKEAIQAVLHFRAPSLKWEYLFFSRNGDSPEGLFLEDTAGLVKFTAFTKKGSAWSTLSKEKVPMRAIYDCKLRLVQQNGDGKQKRILLSRVEPPEAGRFQSEEPGTIRQVCYF